MNRNQLWNSILQQAISGRLVPQLDSEPEVEQIGPAPAQNEAPFELPPKWKWAQLNSVGQIVGGGTPSSRIAEYWENPTISWITTADLTAATSGYVSDGARGITELGLKKCSAKLIPAGSIVYTTRGARIGDLAITAKECCTNQGCKSLVPNTKVLTCKWAYYALMNATPVIRDIAAGTTFAEISGKKFGEVWIPLPPLEEQSRIVAKLDEIRHLVDKFGEDQEQLVKLEAEFPSKLKASVLQQAIKGLLVPQLDSEPEVEQLGPAPKPDEVPFELPPKWKWVQLYAVAEYNPKVDANDDLEVSFVPLEKLSWAYDWEPTFDQTKAWGTVKKGYKRFKDGDVIFAKITPSFHNRKSGLVTKACNGIGCGSTEFCVYRCQEQLLNKFLLWFFKSSYFINFGKRTYKGTAGQLRVNLDVINSMYLPLPPIEEQRRIVAKLEEVFAGVEKLGSLMEYA